MIHTQFIHLENDYVEGAHPKVLQALMETNNIPLSGYGADDFSLKAEDKIKKACNNDDLQVWFLTGGTQTNALVIDAVLKPYEAVISADTGHIATFESGAVEFTGHKVITIPGRNGKLSSVDVEKYLFEYHTHPAKEHIAYPGMVYISLSTEFGTLYSKSELEALYDVCKKYEIPLFIDGARIGYALASKESDLDLSIVSNNCDIFYIGGTKIGALCGEAVVFTKNNMPKNFRSIVKQHGALVAKSRLLSVQFDALFTDNLYFEISKHAVDMAMRLKKILLAKGYEFFIDSPTNLQFVIVTNEQMEKIKDSVKFSVIKTLDNDMKVLRLVTSWYTKPEDIEKLADIF